MANDGQDVFIAALKARIRDDVAAAVAEVERGFVARAAILQQRVGELETELRELKAAKAKQ